MLRRSTLRLSKRTVDALAVENGDAVFRDRDLPGFGIRVYPSGCKVYLVQTRGPKGLKRATLSRHGDLTPQPARKQAADIIAESSAARPPVPPPPGPELTVADLAEHYMRAHAAVNCKPATAANYRRSIDLHILPALGGMTVSSVERKHVAGLHHEMRDTPTEANAVQMTDNGRPRASARLTASRRQYIHRRAANPRHTGANSHARMTPSPALTPSRTLAEPHDGGQIQRPAPPRTPTKPRGPSSSAESPQLKSERTCRDFRSRLFSFDLHHGLRAVRYCAQMASLPV